MHWTLSSNTETLGVLGYLECRVWYIMGLIQENITFQILSLFSKAQEKNWELWMDIKTEPKCCSPRHKPKNIQSDLSRMFFPLSQERHKSTISLSYSCRGLSCRIKAEKKSGKHHCYSVWTETNHNSSWHTPSSPFGSVLLTEHNQDWFDFFRISEKLNGETVGIKR